MAMRLHAVVSLAGLLGGIDVHDCTGKELQMMPKLVLHLFSELMSAFHSQVRCHGDAELGV